MSGLAELIERLEKATGPDRQLDHDIALATGWAQSFSGATGTSPAGLISPDGNYHYSARPFTASIDAALTLVPDGTEGDAARDARVATIVSAATPYWGNTMNIG